MWCDRREVTGCDGRMDRCEDWSSYVDVCHIDTLDLQKIGKITHCAELLFGDGEDGGIVCNLRPPAEKTKITWHHNTAQ